MKRVFAICCLVMLLVGMMAINADAIPIGGGISFSGFDTVDNGNLTLATKFLTFTNVTVQQAVGSYSVIPQNTAATFTPFTFRPTTTPVNPLWTVSFGGKTYNFIATSMVISFSNPGNLVVEGAGTAQITGLDDTLGTWNVTANSTGGAFSFSAGTSVPEPTMLLLIGSGLVAVFGLRRKIRS